MKTFSEREALYRPMLEAAFRNAGFDQSLGPAIARQESNFDPTVRVMTGGDLALGGSYGLCCMSLSSARSLGHSSITPEQLLDPATNASIAAELCRDNRRFVKEDTGLTCSELSFYEDILALYNSGKTFARAPHVTQVSYVPRALSFMRLYGAVL